MDEYIKKEEVANMIERSVCRWCEKYDSGNWSRACTICKVSQCFQCIALATPYLFNPENEIGKNIDIGEEPSNG